MKLRSGKITCISNMELLKPITLQNIPGHSPYYSKVNLIKKDIFYRWKLANAIMNNMKNDKRVFDGILDVKINFDEASKAWRKNKIEKNDATFEYKKYGGMEGLMKWID